MIDGKLLLTTSTATGDGYFVWSPWMPRGADNLLFTMEVAENYSADVAATIFHKNYEDVEEGEKFDDQLLFEDESKRESQTYLGVKELVRVRLTISRNARLHGGEVGYALFRFLQPVWFETANV